MKIEIIKETKITGEEYYFVEIDRRFVNDTIIFIGKDPITKIEYDNAYIRVTKLFENCKNNMKTSKKVVHSEEIVGNE